MQTFHTEVLIMGAGAVGLATALQLEIRKISSIVIDNQEIGLGSTLHCAGVLHSGARYAVTHKKLAAACRQAQLEWLSIAPSTIIAQKSAYYIVWDDESEAYSRALLKACAITGIPVEIAPRSEVLMQTPLLTSQVRFALTVPDLIIDPVLLIAAYMEELRDRGVIVLPNTRITRTTAKSGFWTVELQSASTKEVIKVSCNVVVVSAGAWSVEVLKSFDIDLDAIYIGGKMTVLKAKNITDRIVSLCKQSSSNDSIIPCYETTLLGSTWNVSLSPYSDTLGEDSSNLWNEEFPLIEQKLPVSHSYFGSRVVLQEHKESQKAFDRSISRDYYLLDHGLLHRKPGLISIFGGKLSLHYLMASEAVGLVQEHIGRRSCNTPSLQLKEVKIKPGKHLGSHREGSLLRDWFNPPGNNTPP